MVERKDFLLLFFGCAHPQKIIFKMRASLFLRRVHKPLIKFPNRKGTETRIFFFAIFTFFCFLKNVFCITFNSLQFMFNCCFLIVLAGFIKSGNKSLPSTSSQSTSQPKLPVAPNTIFHNSIDELPSHYVMPSLTEYEQNLINVNYY